MCHLFRPFKNNKAKDGLFQTMCFVSKFVFNLLSIVPPFLVYFSHSTIDINFAEYQHLADHLTEKECHKLVAALHFHTFELPKELDAAERRLPEDTPCIDLLLHWNSTPREGRGQTHVEVCHRLNQIGREDLAQWLSKTVFHEISKELKLDVITKEADDKLRLPSLTEPYSDNEVTDEAAWWKIDSILAMLVVFGLATLIAGSCFLCFLCCTRIPKETCKGYRKLPISDN